MNDDKNKTCCVVKDGATVSFSATLLKYKPLVVAALLSVFLATVLALSGVLPWMNGAMGFFFCFISFLKLLDVRGFASGFVQYDVLARRVPVYARVYPFLEFLLGMFYLAGFAPVLTSLLTVAVLGLTNIGVGQVIRSGRTVACVCAGSGFQLPVGAVTFAENALMILMAAMQLGHFL